MSPIWGGDLAHAIFDALEQEREDTPIGGPETLSFMNAAELAKRAVEEGYAAEEKPRTVAISSAPRSDILFLKHGSSILRQSDQSRTLNVVSP